MPKGVRIAHDAARLASEAIQGDYPSAVIGALCPPHVPVAGSTAMRIRPRILLAILEHHIRRNTELRDRIGMVFLLTFFAFCIAALVLS